MKEYNLTVKETKKGLLCTSENRGFTGLEIVGFLSLKLYDIQSQRAGEIKPKVKYDRTVIEKKKVKRSRKK